MKHAISVLVLSIVAFAPATATDSPATEVVNTGGHYWNIKQVRVTKTDLNTTISGRLNSRQRYGLPKGHIDLAAWSKDGVLLAETTASYTPNQLSKRISRKGGLRFRANMPANLPSDATVKVAFHRNPPIKRAVPAHTRNIAR